MIYLKQIFLSALDDFRRNLLRTFLTTLGIVIGISSVVLLIALGLGLKAFIKTQFEGLGTNIVIILPGKLFQNGKFQPGQNIGGIQLDEKDFSSLGKVKTVEYLAPAYIKTVTVKAQGKTEIADMYATNDEIFPMRNLTLALGEYYTKSDLGKRSKKVVMGPKIAKMLFGSAEDAVNKIIKIENLSFEVLGVLVAKGGGGLGGPDFDSFIYVPYKSVLSLNPNKAFSAINAKIKNGNEIDSAKQEIKRQLLKRYKEDDFSIIEQEEIQNTVTAIYSVLNLVLIAIAGISLLVGGIGIMNIMFVSVIERYKEIGIRRSLGATRRDILLQFLTEAVLLSLLGGLLAILISYAIILIIRIYFPAYLDFTAVCIALLVSAGTGIIFGVLPARNAASLSPVEAIRYE